MPTNITDTEIRDTYDQLLHIDGGPEVTVHGSPRSGEAPYWGQHH
jgi:hypothetical protein